uniref:Immunoglobulin domain-containing protein n=1 Tax=Cyprinus carpio TaxID=7962 RepID=A0A8C1YIK9_CYPCA
MIMTCSSANSIIICSFLCFCVLLSGSVPAGDYVTLNPETVIQRGDKVQWLFGYKDTLIAEIKGENREKTTHEGPDEIFKNRLKLDETTGSLTIKLIDSEHAGLYTLKIRRGRKTLKKKFHVSVRGESLQSGMRSVMEGDRVFLFSDTEIQTDDEVQWLFGDKEQTVLTEIKNTEVTKYDGTDWRFRDRLELDEETGRLTITKFSAEHAEFYTLKITRGRDKIYKRFYIFVEEWKKTVMEGESFTLKPAREIKKDDVIEWLYGDREQQTLIAKLKGKTGEILTRDDVADERFRGRLELDETTRSLTITNTRTAHTGVYKLDITSSSGFSEQTFTVTVMEEKILKEDSVTLKPDTKIQNDEIQWRFGKENSLIAEIKGGTGVTHDDVPDERFRDRLELNKKTGDLIIKNSKYEHAGPYKLKMQILSFVNEFNELIHLVPE